VVRSVLELAEGPEEILSPEVVVAVEEEDLSRQQELLDDLQAVPIRPGEDLEDLAAMIGFFPVWRCREVVSDRARWVREDASVAESG